MERETVFVNVRTRRLYTSTEKVEYITNKNGEKQLHRIAYSEESISEDIIRSQRYTKEVTFLILNKLKKCFFLLINLKYRNKIIKLPDSIKSPANVSIEEKV